MEKGIALYPGLENTGAENLALLEAAHQAGLTRVFMSLHIPETDTEALKLEIGQLLVKARELGLEVMADVDASTTDFQGINTLRVDDGFSLQEIARLTNTCKVVLNASTVTEDWLNQLKIVGADFAKIEALHNFYPRRGTGVSEEFLLTQNQLLHKAGIKVGAFVPSQSGKRGPLREGLPTLESSRSRSVDLAGRHLAALGVDIVLIGDSKPSSQELAALAELAGNRVVVKAQLLSKDPFVCKFLHHVFTARPDVAQDCIRAQESRRLLRGHTLQPENTEIRRPGSVTLDNAGYGRYQGELEIMKNLQPADKRTNVVAQVDAGEMFLLKYIGSKRKFAFQMYQGKNRTF